MTRQLALVHTFTPAWALCTTIRPLRKLVDHHALENVALIVNVVEYVFPKHVQDLGRYHEAVDRHPEPVCEGGESERDDEVGEDGRHEDDERLGCNKVEEQPHYPGEESLRCGLEVGEPVGDNAEDAGNQDCALSVLAFVE